LRNTKKIPLSHLRDVSEKLSHLGDRKWSGTTLYVLGKRVVLEDSSTRNREDVVSGQKVLNIPLRIVIKNTRNRIKEISNRDSSVGKFERGKFVAHNELVFSGTRIPVSIVTDFYEAGYSKLQIIREFPDLKEEDIEAAIENYEGLVAA
jgi:uncharacterized protein (DUF433 family)